MWAANSLDRRDFGPRQDAWALNFQIGDIGRCDQPEKTRQQTGGLVRLVAAVQATSYPLRKIRVLRRGVPGTGIRRHLPGLYL